MNRRGFLTALCAALAAPPDPDKLLWTPGKKLISVPSGKKLISADYWSVLFQREKNISGCAAYQGLCLVGGEPWGSHPLIKTNMDAMMYARNYRNTYYPDHKYVTVVVHSDSGENYIGEIYA